MTMETRDSALPPIQADATNIPKGSIDCGIQAIGCCNGPGCQKLGNVKAFLVIFSLAGILQGAVDNYFRISAQQVALDYGYNVTIVDWLLVASYIAQALLAIIITYWAGKFHHMSWLGSLIMIQAITCIIVIVPTLSTQGTKHSVTEAIPVTHLCVRPQSLRQSFEMPYSIDTLVLMFILQMGTALGMTAFYTLGLSYLDDNAELVDSPALIGTALAARFWGPQFGSAVSLAVNATPFSWWLGWAIIAPALFILGFLLTLFPRRLLKTVIKMAANRIIETNNLPPREPTRFIDDVNLWPSLKRLFCNRILIINIVALMFVEAATLNYLNKEQSYLRSRFFVPSNEATGLINEWTSRFLTHLLKPPAVALSVLVAGLIIAKLNPSARALTAWNISIGIITCLLYVSYIFLKCPDVVVAGTMGNQIFQPPCSQSCECPQNMQFLPVCTQGSVQTYFSPCHAGCSQKIFLNDVTIYQNCTCGQDSSFPVKDISATEGSCNFESSCQKKWVVYQVMTIFSAALLSSGLVGRIIISLRSVMPQDKSLALAIELTITGLFTYIPAKIGYDMVSVYTCQFKSFDRSTCELYKSPLHGNLLNIISAALILIAIILDIVIFVLVKYLDCYRDSTEESTRSIPLRAISSNSRYEEMTNNSSPRDEADGTPLVSNNSPIIRSIQSTQNSFGQSPTPPPPFRDENEENQQLINLSNSSNDEHLDFTIANSETSPQIESSTANGPQTRTARLASPETDF